MVNRLSWYRYLFQCCAQVRDIQAGDRDMVWVVQDVLERYVIIKTFIQGVAGQCVIADWCHTIDMASIAVLS